MTSPIMLVQIACSDYYLSRTVTDVVDAAKDVAAVSGVFVLSLFYGSDYTFFSDVLAILRP